MNGDSSSSDPRGAFDPPAPLVAPPLVDPTVAPLVDPVVAPELVGPAVAPEPVGSVAPLTASRLASFADAAASLLAGLVTTLVGASFTRAIASPRSSSPTSPAIAVTVPRIARMFARPAAPVHPETGLPSPGGRPAGAAAETSMPLPRLNGTLTPSGSPRYDQLFAGQLMTAVLAVGFDEYGSNRPIDDALQEGLVSRGFRVDTTAALARLAAGKRPTPARVGDLYYAEGAAHDSAGRPVDVVVTLALAGDGSNGGDVASAYLDGLGRCDLAAYGGHGRYGTGPDFDYNFTADLVDERGNVTASFSEYKDLEEALTAQGKLHGRGPIAEYKLLMKQKRLEVRRINSGNLVINLRNYHAAEFGSHLMVDQLATDPNIRRFSRQKFDKKYRLWMFSGCRTHDYFYNLRKLNPAANAGGLDLIGTRRVCYWNATADNLLGLLDGVFARDTYKQLLDRLAALNPTYYETDDKGPSHVVDVGRRP
jgi:hypothetical protein